MDVAAPPWFVGAWRRRSIAIPGGAPTEPCEAWWVQSDDWFVDVRRTLPGREDNGLPYSSTRAFAGRFEIVDGEVRWHLHLDTDGLAPRTDRASANGLHISDTDPLLMIEDAPGRFREEWVQHAPSRICQGSGADAAIRVTVGSIRGEVRSTAAGVIGHIWDDGRLLVEVGDIEQPGRHR
jgi:hypothetical protein